MEHVDVVPSVTPAEQPLESKLPWTTPAVVEFSVTEVTAAAQAGTVSADGLGYS